MKYTATVIVLSDKGSRGEREDTSGPAVRKLLEEGFDVKDIIIIPDDIETIIQTIADQIDNLGIDLIVTSGGTGLSKRDVTPEATRALIDRELPGFSEIMRSESYKITPHGIISRGICGTRKESLIINLPGSPKAAVECLSFVLGAIPHTLSKLKGDAADCARR